MIFYAKDCQASTRQEVKGGTGEVGFLFSMTSDIHPGNSCFQVVGQVTLPPGSSIGFHIHDQEEEIFLITSGSGIYTDSNGQTCSVVAGDMTLTRRGEGHGLSNPGDQPLSFMAIIAA